MRASFKIKLKQIIFTLLLTPALLSACAKKNEHHSPAQSPNQATPLVKVEKQASFEQALVVANSTSLHCETQADCPAAVGLLLAADKAGGFMPDSDSVAACTAALVGEDLVLTNSHCLPSTLRLMPDLCAERVRLVFPQTAEHPEETIACAAVLGFSERETEMSPDLALLRLGRKTKRAPFSASRSGVANFTPLKSYKVNPDLKKLTGFLRAETCVSAANSYRMPIYQNLQSPAVVLGDCTALPGNSGSPLLSPSGELVALMQADLPISDNARREWKVESEGRISPLALGTSLICLAANLPEWKWNEICATVTEEDVALAPRPRIRQFLSSPELQQKAQSLLAPFTAQSKLLGWHRVEEQTKPLRRLEKLVPQCLAPSAEWVSHFSDNNNLAESAELVLEIPQLSLEIRFNRYLQPAAPVALLHASEKKLYRFSPKLAAEAGTLELASDKEKLTLPLCGQSPDPH